MSVDVEKLLTEISPEAPCGGDLRYDPAYLELERVAQGTPEREMGAEKIAAEEPDWRAVREAAMELLKRSRDLRLVLYLALSLLKLEGFAGLRDGLAVLRGCLERYWETVHPRLDPEDNNDPLERVNIIASMSLPAGSFQDPMRFIQRVREARLCSSRQLGQFGLRDILIATGQMPAPAGAEAANAAVIEAAFADTDAGELQATAAAAVEAAGHVRAIDEKLTALVGAGRAPNLDGLRQAVEEVSGHLAGYLAKRGMGTGGAGVPSAGAAGAAGGPAAGPAISGDIRSREDVINVLEKICRFYEQHEPSSPIPLLLKRAQRLVAKSFLDIVRDLTPEAMNQINVIGGIEIRAPQE
jgi:type VI secretion system protein ImpA